MKISLFNLFAVSLIVLLLSCNKKGNNVKKEMVLTEKLERVVLLYIKENNISKGCINEIYFDKVDSHKTLITIRTRDYSEKYLLNSKPYFYIKVKGIVFFIYSGMEDYLNFNQNIDKPESESVYCPTVFWNVVDSFKTVKIIKNGSPPFFPLQEQRKFPLPIK